MMDVQTKISAAGCLISGLIIFITCRRYLSFVTLLSAALVLPAANLAMGVFLNVTILKCPEVFDVTLAQFDGTVGFQPSAAAVWFLNSSRPLLYLCAMVYLLLPLSIALSASTEIRSKSIQGISVVPTFLITGVIGFCIYFYVPAVGPGPFFGMSMPFVLHQSNFKISASDINNFPRNCVPSLHTTWATLAFLATRQRSAWVRITSGSFLSLTMLATLGFACHYLIDLVIAAPFVLFIRGICATQTPWKWHRCVATALGFCLVLGWTTAIRAGAPVGWVQTAIPVAMLMTVIISISAEILLYNSEQKSIFRSVSLSKIETKILCV